MGASGEAKSSNRQGHYIGLYLAPHEHEHLERLAAAAGKKKNTYLRELIVAQKPKPR